MVGTFVCVCLFVFPSVSKKKYNKKHLKSKKVFEQNKEVFGFTIICFRLFTYS